MRGRSSVLPQPPASVQITQGEDGSCVLGGKIVRTGVFPVRASSRGGRARTSVRVTSVGSPDNQGRSRDWDQGNAVVNIYMVCWESLLLRNLVMVSEENVRQSIASTGV